MLLRMETTSQPRIHPFPKTSLEPPCNQMYSPPTGWILKSSHHQPRWPSPAVVKTTSGQTSIPLIFDTMPPLTSLMVTTTAASTHYSTILTTTSGTTNEYDVHLIDYDSSEDSDRDYYIPPRRRTDVDCDQGPRHRLRQNNPRVPWTYQPGVWELDSSFWKEDRSVDERYGGSSSKETTARATIKVWEPSKLRYEHDLFIAYRWSR